MSTLKVTVERIRAVEKHPNADRLDLVQVLDWRVVTAKGQYEVGDLCVYFPIDSVLPADLEEFLFPADSKIKLNKSRIRTIKLRGAVSQGMCVRVSEIQQHLRGKREASITQYGGFIAEGSDLTAILSVTKYEPPVSPMSTNSQQAPAAHKHPEFKEYTDLENAKNYPDVFVPGESVAVFEKIHGTNFRAGYLPYRTNSLWKTLLKFLKLAPTHEFCYGSRRVQLQNRKGKSSGYYEQGSNSDDQRPLGNVYSEAVFEYNLEDALKAGEVVYGEIYGDGIQKNYSYACAKGERRLVLFDVKVDGEFLNAEAFVRWCNLRGFVHAPLLYTGPYDAALVKKLTEGPSVLAPEQKVREGVVVRPTTEKSHPMLGRQILKVISDEYLLRDQTEFH